MCIYFCLIEKPSLPSFRPWGNNAPLQFLLPPSLLLLLLQLHLRRLLPPRDDGLGADAAEHKADAEPLPAAEAVAEPDYGEDHREHFPGHGHGDEEEGGECRESVD